MLNARFRIEESHRNLWLGKIIGGHLTTEAKGKVYSPQDFVVAANHFCDDAITASEALQITVDGF